MRMWLVLALFLVSSSATALSIKVVTGYEYGFLAGQKLPDHGFLSELVKEAFAKSNISTKFSFRPWKRAWLETETGKFDASFPWFMNSDRKKTMLFSDELYTTRFMAIVRKSEKIDEVTRASMKNKRICDVRGSQIGAKHFADSEIVYVTHADDCFLAFKLRRTSTVIVSLDRLPQIDFYKGTFRLVPTDLPSQTSYVVFARSNKIAPALLSRLNSGLKSLRLSGEYDHLLKKHVNFLPKQTVLDEP